MSSQNSPAHIYLDEGVYSVTFSVDPGGECEWVTMFDITVVAEPEIQIVITHASGADVPDGAVEVTVTGGVEPYEVTCTSAKSQHDFTGLLPGSYTINVEDANGHTASEEFTVNWTSGTEEVVTDFSVYPNPANSQLTVHSDSEIPALIRISDLSGQIVLENKPCSETTTLDINRLSPGMYLIDIRFSDKHFILKLTVDN